MLSPGGWRFVEKGIASVRVRGNWSSTKVKRVVNFQDFLFISGNFQTCKAFAPYVEASVQKANCLHEWLQAWQLWFAFIAVCHR